MKKEKDVQAIILKARDKLKTARLDFDGGQYDDAVSRAYYAVFHMMTAALFSRDQVYTSHAQTIGAFNREFIKTSIFPKGFTKMIQGLFEERQTGDYDVSVWIDVDTAEINIRNAEAICFAIEEYLTHLP